MRRCCFPAHASFTACATALSIWLKNFTPEQRRATDIEDIACYASEHDRLMQHWRDVLPLPMLKVRYEDTVADLEAQAQRLTDFLGLRRGTNAVSSFTAVMGLFRRRAAGKCVNRSTRARSGVGRDTPITCRS